MSKHLKHELELEARKNFFEHGIEDTDVFPQEVYLSWRRSLAYGLDPNVQNVVRLTPDELRERRNQNCLLLRVAVPIMEYLYKMVSGSEFVILLCDADGYVLQVIGDPDPVIYIQSKENPVFEGVCRHESVFGTGGLGTPMAIRKPIQLSANAMFYESDYHFTGSGAPLIDTDGRLWGALCISGPYYKMHSHTLGMAASAAYAIMRQFTLQKAYDKISVQEQQMQIILSHFDQGVFLLDQNYQIIDVNEAALKDLNYTRRELISSPASDLFPYDFPKITKNIYDDEQTIRGKYKSIQVFLNVQIVRPNTPETSASLLITMRKSSSVRQMVNRYIGSTASFTFDDILGESAALSTAKVYAQIASSNTANVLLLGESGTGKELFAQSIHNGSKYSVGPFVAVNCGAIPRSLIESELFGYEAGAFTGAKQEGNAGKFELANNGTIFLDEIGDMPYDVQVHLLRILQTKEVTRIGGKKPIQLNIRVIAGTNVDLLHAVEDKTFRKDLYYRLNVLSIQIPPLRERGNDILLLANYFISKYQLPDRQPILGMTSEVQDLFMRYSWPGNIRELENTIERACLLTGSEKITMQDIPQSMVAQLRDSEKSPAVSASRAAERSDRMSISESERDLIIQHIQNAGGNIRKAAESLGISRRTLYRRLEKYGIDYRGDMSDD